MQITSTAFTDGGRIPQPYVMPGAGGKNISLPFTWSAVPADTRSFALSIVDPHPVANNWVHWLLLNLPADTRELAQGLSGGDLPGGAVELGNSFGQVGYGGPQPPPGSGDHPYVVTLYALKTDRLELPVNIDLSAFLAALKDHILEQAVVTGMYGR